MSESLTCGQNITKNGELLPCPFCGGEASMRLFYGGKYRVHCNDCDAHSGGTCDTEAEAIATWNTRAAYEMDGWFYLPKPKEGIVDYGEPEITRTENGYKVWQFADVVDEAARKWGDELGDYAMKRICEVWNTRAERTCKLGGEVPAFDMTLNMLADIPWYWCLECGAATPSISNYCMHCGAKVVCE